MIEPKILVAQLGARKHYQEPIFFHKNNVLEYLFTDLYMGNNVIFSKIRKSALSIKLPMVFRQALERFDSQLNNAQIVHFPSLAYRYREELKQAAPHKTAKINVKYGKMLCQNIINHGLGNTNIIYGFDGSCLELFEYAKKRGIRCILDQTVAERTLIQKLLLEEEALWPGWSKYPFDIDEYDLRLAERQSQEQYLADHIICGSSFVKDSLVCKGISPNKITVVSLGSEKVKTDSLPRTKIDQPNLNILFGGSVGLRKGIQYLLAALHMLENCIPFTCKIAGGIELTDARISECKNISQFLGRVPRSEMNELYKWADVFVLPSVCEGSAMVTYEALSWGLPIITTKNAGSVARDNQDGFIVPIRDPAALSRKLIEIYNHPNKYAKPLQNMEYLQSIYTESLTKLNDVVTSIL